MEPVLDHGPGVAAVQLGSGLVCPTRPDVIGLRRSPGDPEGPARVVIIDYKLRGQVVWPAWDTGLLVRAIWAFNELHRPRSRWFLAGWDLDVDREAVELEVLNLLHAGTEQAVLTHTLTLAEARAGRQRLLALAEELGRLDGCRDVDEVEATPGGLCRAWCPVLHRCPVGRAYVAHTAGSEALRRRLAERPGGPR
ncbi:MAG TPA: hypothetical protein VMU90_00505 [Solirubrobacteraceae bacterium]|nr:hypothetical protein [Solirubrobacteraceae bacterium]